MSIRMVNVCWFPGGTSFQQPASDGSCPSGAIHYDGPLREEDIGFGVEIMMVWDGAATPPGPRPMTDAEILIEARRRKKAELETAHSPALDALYLPSVREGVAMDLPTTSFSAVVRNDMRRMMLALKAAKLAVDSAALEDLPALATQYPEIVPADPDDPIYQE